ncbi:hypothetical protein KW456_09745 [Vibrio fluvialis]|nr:hypothetical protein [Vibrio fluvialis]
MTRTITINGKNKEIDLNKEYRGSLSDSEIGKLYDSMKEFEPILNTVLRQTLNRLVAHADDTVSPLSFDNIKSYQDEINQQLNQGDSGKRVYRANLKKLFTSIDFGDDITRLVSQRKGRSGTGASIAERVLLGDEERRTKSHKPKHKSRGLNNEQAKRPSESNVLDIDPLKLTLKNSSNQIISINLGESFASPYISEADLKLYAKRVKDGSTSQTTKWNYLNELSALIRYNNEVTKQPVFYAKDVYQSYINHLIDLVQKGKLKNKMETIEKKQTFLSNGFKLLGLPVINKSDRFKIRAGGNELQTDNYDNTSWIATVRTLIPEHERLYKATQNANNEQDFNDFIACSCLLLTVYTGMTFSELANMVCEEYDTTYTRLGTKDIAYSAIKYRASIENSYSNFTAKRSAKTCVDRLMEVVQETKIKYGITSNRVLFMLNEGVASQITTVDISGFSGKLMRQSRILLDLLEKRPNYKLGLQRIRSSVIQRVSTVRGEAAGLIAGRHSLSVHRAYNYSKVSNESAQKDMTKTAHSLEMYARGETIKVSVDAGRNLYKPKIINQKEKEESGVCELKNGGTCEGKETPESKEFRKRLDKNKLLKDEDKKYMGCGFIIKCFGCSNFAVVDEVNDIWKLLSFESILNSSIESHVSLAHYIDKQVELKNKLLLIKDKLNPRKLKTAEKKLEKKGLHPLWNGLYAVLDKMEL